MKTGILLLDGEYNSLKSFTLKYLPLKFTFSPFMICQKHSTYSRILGNGSLNSRPCQFSTRVGVLTPSPMISLSLESRSSVIAAIAVVAGDLVYMLVIEVPSLTLLVIWERAPSEENASLPQDSGIHIESTFSVLSTSFANKSSSLVESKLPGLYAILKGLILSIVLHQALLLLLQYPYESRLISKMIFHILPPLTSFP